MKKATGTPRLSMSKQGDSCSISTAILMIQMKKKIIDSLQLSHIDELWSFSLRVELARDVLPNVMDRPEN